MLGCEGPTDTAAALDLGFAAVGRASCGTGGPMLSKLARGRDVVIVGDDDAPGRRGAEALGAVLVLGCTSVCIVYPPEGVKDLRQWKAAGLTGQELQAAIDAVEPARLDVHAKITPKDGKDSHGRRKRNP